MRPVVRTTFLLLVLALASACGARSGAPNSTRSDLIVLSEVSAGSFTNVFDLVQAMRPNWLRARSPNSFQSPGFVQVYLDDVRLGGVENLRTLAVQGVQYIRWYDPISASSRWGLNHEQGAIVVSMRPL